MSMLTALTITLMIVAGCALFVLVVGIWGIWQNDPPQSLPPDASWGDWEEEEGEVQP